MLAALESCLSEQRKEGSSREAALAMCEPLAPINVPEEIRFTEGPSGFILREYGPDGGCAHESCRDYEVTGRVAWSGLTGPASVQCYGGGRLDEGFSVDATVLWGAKMSSVSGKSDVVDFPPKLSE